MASHTMLGALDESTRDLWHENNFRAERRADKNQISALIMEFIAPFSQPLPQIRYEAAFVCDWCQSTPRLYETRHWICEYTAGVYFIYDSSEVLKYVGSSCGGSLGNRIYRTKHHEYRAFVDVVLFDQAWLHFALAFEVLAISRLSGRFPELNSDLQSLVNKNFASLWIPPIAPYDKIWSQVPQAGH